MSFGLSTTAPGRPCWTENGHEAIPEDQDRARPLPARLNRRPGRRLPWCPRHPLAQLWVGTNSNSHVLSSAVLRNQEVLGDQRAGNTCCWGKSLVFGSFSLPAERNYGRSDLLFSAFVSTWWLTLPTFCWLTRWYPLAVLRLFLAIPREINSRYWLALIFHRP